MQKENNVVFSSCVMDEVFIIIIFKPVHVHSKGWDLVGNCEDESERMKNINVPIGSLPFIVL